jgi:hypothetical protein
MARDEEASIEKINKPIPQSAEDELEEEDALKVEQEIKMWPKNHPLLLASVFLLGLVPRLYFLIFFGKGGPGYFWYGDVYHRWQIAYLSMTKGFSEGFLRLWDLKGLEFFWGTFHTFITIFLFKLTGSVDILIPRLLSIVSGAFVVLFLFILVRRYFNLQTALAAAIIMAFFPVVLFSDTTGEQEPFGLALMFAGMLFWPKKPFLTGFFWALASMVRAEYWLFALGLVFATIVIKRKLEHWVLLLIGYAIPIILYMKYMLDYTNNPIYPIWTNFFASVAGEWIGENPMTGEMVMAQWISRGIFVLGLVGCLITFFRKPRYFQLFLLGFANIMFIGFILGFGAYINGYITRIWIDRLFLWPYAFSGILLAIIFFYWAARAISVKRINTAWVPFILLILLSQLIWQPIMHYYEKAVEKWPPEKKVAETIAPYYQGGGILLPEDRPAVVYALVRYHSLEGKNIVGQMFDPYFYFEEDPYSDWSEYREEVLDWFKKENIKLFVFTPDRQRYLELVEREPEVFNKVFAGQGVWIYEVKN